jgi:hypothetical protein
VPIIEDKNRMEALLRACDLEWVAVRFPNIVEGPAKPVKTRRVGLEITTGSAAEILLDQLTDDTFLRATPSASN